MLGKTHMMVGIASTLAITRPHKLSGIVMAAGVGAVGALISDIDVGTSKSHKDADKIVLLSVLAIAAASVADHFGNLGLINKIMQNSSITRIIIGCLIFIVTCAFGKEQPHRSFMHSFPALIILDFAIGMIYLPAVPYFTIGFLSHLATDIFNKRKVRLLYPLKVGFSLNMFHACGIANTIFFVAGCIVTVTEIIVLMI